MNIYDFIQEAFPGSVDWHPNPLSTERREQYKKVFGEQYFSNIEMKFKSEMSDEDKNDVDQPRMFKKYIEDMCEKILTKNPELTPLRESLDIQYIYSHKDSTQTFLLNNKEVILMDRNTMVFLWMLNKAFIAGIDLGDGKSLNIIEQIMLFVEILMHYFTLKHNNLGLYYKKPKTPPHSDRSKFLILNQTTMFQEEYIIAHEIAHMNVVTEEALIRHSHLIDEVKNMLGESSIHNLSAACEELEADRLALDYLIETYMRDDSQEVVFQSIVQSVFLLIRYFLWFSILEPEEGDVNVEFSSWFCRNHHFRQNVRELMKKYRIHAEEYLIQMLDDLESSFECAVLIAKDILFNEYSEKGILLYTK